MALWSRILLAEVALGICTQQPEFHEPLVMKSGDICSLPGGEAVKKYLLAFSQRDCVTVQGA